MKTTKLIVVRHGNTFNKGDTILRVGSKTDLPLTATGVQQGRQAGLALKEMQLYPTCFFSASLKRTLETCNEISKVFEHRELPIISNFLLEFDYGPDEGKPESEVLKRLGNEEANLSGKIDVQPLEAEEMGRESLKRWDAEKRLPKGWSFLQPRVSHLEQDWIDFAQEIIAKPQGETVVAVTSNGIARFSTAILPPSAQYPENLKLSTGAFGVYEHNGKFWELKNWNVR